MAFYFHCEFELHRLQIPVFSFSKLKWLLLYLLNLLLLNLGNDERDIVILRHEFVVRWPDNTREEKGVNFVAYGKPANQGKSNVFFMLI